MLRKINGSNYPKRPALILSPTAYEEYAMEIISRERNVPMPELLRRREELIRNDMRLTYPVTAEEIVDNYKEPLQ